MLPPDVSDAELRKRQAKNYETDAPIARSEAASQMLLSAQDDSGPKVG
jgi:hypothetical protein